MPKSCSNIYDNQTHSRNIDLYFYKKILFCSHQTPKISLLLGIAVYLIVFIRLVIELYLNAIYADDSHTFSLT